MTRAGEARFSGEPAATPAQVAASQAALLRSFDGFESALHEILEQSTHEDSSALTLQECVREVRAAGLLSDEEIGTWAAARRLHQLSRSTSDPAPGLSVIEQALARMLRLQVTLTDRRRQLRDKALIP